MAPAAVEPGGQVRQADEFETEAKTSVPGSVGLGGGEAEGLVLSHAVSARAEVEWKHQKLGRLAVERLIPMCATTSTMHLASHASDWLHVACAELQLLTLPLGAGPSSSRSAPIIPVHPDRITRSAS